MRFTPKTEEEIQRSSLVDPGVYDFVVVAAKDKTSKSGRDMIEIQIKIWDISGIEHILFDYLLEAMAHKLRHFAEATGLIDKYDFGHLTAEDCLGKIGKAEIIIQDGQPKPEGGIYPHKNSVKDYLKTSPTDVISVKNKSSQDKDDGFLSDDLPF